MSDKKCYCSFCGKTAEEVAVLIAGPGETFICDECVGLCVTLVVEHRVRDSGSAPKVAINAAEKSRQADEAIRLECLKIAAQVEPKHDPRVVANILFSYVKCGVKKADPCQDTASEQARRASAEAPDNAGEGA